MMLLFMLGTLYDCTVGTCSRSSWAKTEQSCLFEISAFCLFLDTNNASDLRVLMKQDSFLSFFKREQFFPAF